MLSTDARVSECHRLTRNIRAEETKHTHPVTQSVCESVCVCVCVCESVGVRASASYLMDSSAVMFLSDSHSDGTHSPMQRHISTNLMKKHTPPDPSLRMRRFSANVYF